MPLTGATGYDTVVGSSAPGSSLTDFTLYVDFVPSAAWSSAFAAQGGNLGQIRVTSADGATEYARDVLPGTTSSHVYLRVLWPGAQSGTPTVRVYPDATGSYGVSDTYGQYAAYDGYWNALWCAEEASGNLADRTVNGYSGTTTNVTYAQPGKLGSSIAMATNGDVEFSASSTMVGSATEFTLSAWVRPSVLSFDQRILTLCNGSSSAFAILCGRTINTFSVFGRNSGGSLVQVDAGGAYSINEWAHVVATIAGSTLNLFVNTSNTSASAAAAQTLTVTSTPAIAGAQPGGGAGNLSGRLDDIQMHSVARSAAWIGYEHTLTNGSFWTDSGWTSLAAGAAAAWAFRKYVLWRRG